MHGLLFLIERQKETKQNKSTTSGPHPVWFQLRCDWWSPGLPRWLAHPEDDHWFEQYLVFCGFFLAPNNPASYQHTKIKRHRRRSLKNKRKWILAQLGVSARFGRPRDEIFVRGLRWWSLWNEWILPRMQDENSSNSPFSQLIIPASSGN